MWTTKEWYSWHQREKSGSSHTHDGLGCSKRTLPPITNCCLISRLQNSFSLFSCSFRFSTSWTGILRAFMWNHPPASVQGGQTTKSSGGCFPNSVSTHSCCCLSLRSHPVAVSSDNPCRPVFSTSGTNRGGQNTSTTAYFSPKWGLLEAVFTWLFNFLSCFLVSPPSVLLTGMFVAAWHVCWGHGHDSPLVKGAGLDSTSTPLLSQLSPSLPRLSPEFRWWALITMSGTGTSLGIGGSLTTACTSLGLSRTGKSMTFRTYCPATLEASSISTAPEKRHNRSLSKFSTAPSFFKAGRDSSKGASPLTMAAWMVPKRPARPIGMITVFVDVSLSPFPNLKMFISVRNSGAYRPSLCQSCWNCCSVRSPMMVFPQPESMTAKPGLLTRRTSAGSLPGQLLASHRSARRCNKVCWHPTEPQTEAALSLPTHSQQRS